MEDDGNETDASRGNTLTETSGDIPQDADKKFGTYSRDFEEGDSEYLAHAGNLDTDICGANQPLSIVAWVKTENYSDLKAVVSKYAYFTADKQYSMRITADEKIFLRLSNNGSTNNDATGSTTLNFGEWYHLAAVYNDTDIRLYVNGVLDSNGADNPKTYSSGISCEPTEFLIGAQHNTLTTIDSPFDGLMDDVGIFDVARTTSDLDDIIANGLLLGASGAARRIIMIY